jgi:hypothetical protein
MFLLKATMRVSGPDCPAICIVVTSAPEPALGGMSQFTADYLPVRLTLELKKVLNHDRGGAPRHWRKKNY